MSCQTSEDNDLITGYLNGKLDPAAVDKLELHLVECSLCQCKVELLQVMRQELAVRAHEIRAYSGSRGHLRWSWVAVAALILLISGFVVRQFRQHHPTGDVAEHKSSDNASGMPGKSVDRPSEAASKAGEQPVPSSEHNSPPVMTAVNPVKTLPQSVAKSSTKDNEESHGLPHTNTENPPVAKPQDAVVAHVENPVTKPSSQIATTTPSALMSDEGEREIFRLSAVRAPAYDFSGVASRHFTVSGSGARTDQAPLSGEQRAVFESAMRAYVDGNYDETIDLLQRVLAADASVTDANFYLGVSLLLKGRPDQAFAPLKAAAANPRVRWTQPAHYYLAKAYLQTRDLASAEEQLKAAAAMTGSLTASARKDLADVQALRTRENR